MSRLDDEIEKVKAALVRHRKRIDDMSAATGIICCPGCAFGQEYTEAYNKLDRTAKWACVLLRRRNRPEELSLANRIEMGAWP